MDFLRSRIEELYKSYEEPEFDDEGKYMTKKLKKAPTLNPDQQTEMD